MDAQIARPIVNAQKLVKVERHEERGMAEHYRSERRQIEDEAKTIAKNAERGLGIDKDRLRVDVNSIRVMHYSDVKDIEGNPEEEPNREAVRVYNKNSKDEKNKIIFAAQSNACILKDLVDKELLIFNVFYVKSSKAQDGQLREKIKERFKEFIEKHFQGEKKGCGCVSGEHICQLILEAGKFEQVKELSRDAKYICKRCWRVSKSKDSLCEAMDIKPS